MKEMLGEIPYMHRMGATDHNHTIFEGQLPAHKRIQFSMN